MEMSRLSFPLGTGHLYRASERSWACHGTNRLCGCHQYASRDVVLAVFDRAATSFARGLSGAPVWIFLSDGKQQADSAEISPADMEMLPIKSYWRR
jgi:hypothetical protein